MIKTGRLPAVREGARWRIERDSLSEVDAPDRAARRRQASELKDKIEDAIDRATPADDKAKKRYSVWDLEAFQLNRDLIRELDALETKKAETTAARESLRECLRRLTVGCRHQFQPELKAACYIEARSHASSALADLALSGTDAVEPLAERLEAELLRKLRGLIRRAETGGRDSLAPGPR